MLQLFYVPICPHAQRVRALLAELALEYEGHVVDPVRDRELLLGLVPDGQLPLLVDEEARGLDDGPLVLFDSLVIGDYLAELAGWQDGYARERALRTLQRLAMRRFDALIVPLHLRSLRDPHALGETELLELRAELGRLEALIERLGGEARGALALHVAPWWARISWMGAYAPVLSVLIESDIVRFWLDRTLELPGIARTMPRRDDVVRYYKEKYRGAP